MSIANNFGIPDVEDPDPYGVKALQAEGLEIREAGTKSRPSAEVFEFKPATTSPIYSNFRKSMDLRERANSWRGSMTSIASVDKGTQTDEEDSRSAIYSPTKRNSQPPSPIRKETEHVQESSDDDDNNDVDVDVDDGDVDDAQANGLESSVQESSHIETAVPVVVRARMVSVPKRVPPSLPPRNPNRTSQLKKDEKDADGFDTVSLNGSDHSNVTLEKRKSNAEERHSTDKTQRLSTDGKHHINVNGTPGVAGEDEFHSVPPSPANERSQGIPGAF